MSVLAEEPGTYLRALAMRIKFENEEAERRSKLEAEVTYSTHDTGSRYTESSRDPRAATPLLVSAVRTRTIWC